MNEPADFKALQQAMIETQFKARGITDERLLQTFKNIPRHKFVPAEFQKDAYGDFPLPIGEGQTISQPYMVALMTAALDIQPSDKILEIGTGSGYQTAILSVLARKVYSVERLPGLTRKAQALLDELQHLNILIKVDDGTLGWKENAPYDKIIVTAGAPGVPEPLIEQLKTGGTLVIPIDNNDGQVLMRIKKEHKTILQEKICGCTFVPLIGKFGHNK